MPRGKPGIYARGSTDNRIGWPASPDARVGETEGAVERVRLRATDIRTYDGRLVLPNSEIFTSRVTNNTASPIRRAGVELHLGYSINLPRAVEILRETVASAEGVLPEKPVTVRVSALGTNDLSLELRFWADARRSDYVATQAAVSAAAVAALRQGGIPLPGPDQRGFGATRAETLAQRARGESHGQELSKHRAMKLSDPPTECRS
jgi:small-conductance mechanosensitive channel